MRLELIGGVVNLQEMKMLTRDIYFNVKANKIFI